MRQFEDMLVDIISDYGAPSYALCQKKNVTTQVVGQQESSK